MDKKLYRVWGTVPVWCDIQAESRAKAIDESLADGEWELCDHDSHPGVRAYIYDIEPYQDDGSLTVTSNKQAANAAREFATSLRERVAVMAAVTGTSQREMMSYLIDALEGERGLIDD